MRFLARFGATASFCVISFLGQTAARAAEVILYDFFDFGGANVTLTQSAPDLDVYNFDNDVESIRVISGTWSFHRDDNFQNGNGPSITLGPGNYSNIEALGFPADRMSSVQLLQDDAPPPPPEPEPACKPPYQVLGDNGQCLFQCAAGTVPDPASGQCICGQGLIETGQDPQGRRICGPYTVAPPQQAHWVEINGYSIDNRAYETFDRDVTLSANVSVSPGLQNARLEYRAAEGPLVYDDAAKRQILSAAPWLVYQFASTVRPNPINFQISDGAGERYVYFQVRARTSDASGAPAWISSLPHVDEIVRRADEIRYVPAGQAFAEASANGFAFMTDNLGFDEYRCAIQRNGDGLMLFAEYEAFRGPGQLILPSPCIFGLFGGRPLAAGWSFAGRIEVDPGTCGVGQVSYPPAADNAYPENPALFVQIFVDFNYNPNLFTSCLLYGWTLPAVGLRGPAGVDWRQAFR